MILVLWASPNLEGLTAQAKDRVLQGIAQTGAATETIHLNTCNLQRCLTCDNGWGTCRSKGSCIIADDFASIYEAMVRAEGLVFVTPVYWHDLAESLKSFLDRLRRCEAAHNHYLKDKKSMLVACAGGSGNGAIKCLLNLEETLKHMAMKPVERIPVIQLNKSYMLPALEGAGKAFAELIKADLKK